ncbi:alternate-type signal peptide domain-containing protein [Isoptericola sp. NEAU-Y5]|uniref:Alternate-type signal peptide domain-containing protein n=1 Tax=Isoptericola luteus TaxID=2879484 RepID=A0ABS7ZJI4_9MICO|nr:alternate-type signal peptide domain-containing protein [Isoptericola sp. NEAU-Y5]MCA5895185.1 alternate-type signal peptide domain-containing protein [Isoptericola sp. NEAU-Y5]
MQKKTKGLVAGVAGGALLLGTAGTFALWSDTDTIGRAEITGGAFKLTAPAMSWAEYEIDEVGEGKELDGSGDSTLKIVPGVVLKGKTTISTELSGDHLAAELKIDGVETQPEWLDITWQLEGSEAGEGWTTTLTPASAGTTELSVAIQLKEQGGKYSTVKDKTWGPENIEVTLEQLPPSSTLPQP